MIPMLGYKEMSIEEALREYLEPTENPDQDVTADFESLPPQIRPIVDAADASYVTYVSPSSLRLSLESHVAAEGESGLEREHLRDLHPELYYNFWWYCARFSLPLPLPVCNSPKHYCTLVAW